MKKLLIVTLISTVLLSGCATDDYARYATMQETVAKANSDARIAEANAIAEIGKSGSDAAKVAAVMTLRSSTEQRSQVGLQPPKSLSDQLLGWVGVLAPTLVQGYSIHSQTQLGLRQSDNGAAIAASTNNAFVGIAGKIQAPVTVVPQANVTTTTSGGSVNGGGSATTLSGTGSTGNGGYTTNANPTTTTTTTTNTTTDNHSNQNNPITTTNPITGK